MTAEKYYSIPIGKKVSSSPVRLSGRVAGVKVLFGLGEAQPFTWQRYNQTAM